MGGQPQEWVEGQGESVLGFSLSYTFTAGSVPHKAASLPGATPGIRAVLVVVGLLQGLDILGVQALHMAGTGLAPLLLLLTLRCAAAAACHCCHRCVCSWACSMPHPGDTTPLPCSSWCLSTAHCHAVSRLLLAAAGGCWRLLLAAAAAMLGMAAMVGHSTVLCQVVAESRWQAAAAAGAAVCRGVL